LRHEKEECRRVKTELEQLKRQRPQAVDTLTSAEHFTQRVLELATQQQEVERRQREQRTSLASSGEYNNLSSNNRVSGDGSGHFRDTDVAGTEAADTEVAGMEVIEIGARRSSRSPSVTCESSPHTPMQHPRPAGSVPTALFGNSREHHRHQQASPVVGPVVRIRVYEEHRGWKTGRDGRESVSSSSGYCNSDYDSSVGGGENDI
jgi:hypothetical protein